jgi:hypothetical protein
VARWETSEEIAAGIERGELALTDSFRQMDGTDWNKAPRLGAILPDPSQAALGIVGYQVMGLREGTYWWVARLQAIRIVEHQE